MCTVTLSYNEFDKEYYTPEELREQLIADLNQIYAVKDALLLFMTPATPRT